MLLAGKFQIFVLLFTYLLSEVYFIIYYSFISIFIDTLSMGEDSDPAWRNHGHPDLYFETEYKTA
jgi:hypothetical protein